MSTSERTTGDPAFEALLRDLARAPAVKLADLDLSGRALGRFEVRRRIGAGGMGAVYEAWDTRLLRVVALKVLHAWKGGGHDSAARLVAEARRAAAVSHPSIAAVYDVDTIDGVTFLAGERVHGRSLERVLASGGVRPEEAIRIARRIASALGCAHRAGIVHRDLTPANVMIGAGGAVKLLDFGIATTSASSAGGPTGTPGYMAPEQVEGGVVDARADVFSFGVLLQALLAGRARPGTEPLVREARRLGQRCVARAPADRPADGDALVAALRALGRARPADLPARSVASWLGGIVAASALGGLILLAPAAPRSAHVGVARAREPLAAREVGDALDGGLPAPRPRASSTAASSIEHTSSLTPAPEPRAARAAPGDPPVMLQPGGASFVAPAPAELPVSAYVDDEGRLVTIADLRGADPRRIDAIGDLILRAAPRRDAAFVEPELRRGTLGVSAGPRGSLRITLDLETSARTASLAEEKGVDLDGRAVSRAPSAQGTSEQTEEISVDGGAVLTKGVAMGASAGSPTRARDGKVSVCGLPILTSLSLRLTASGAVEIAPSFDALVEERPPLAVLDPTLGLLRAAPGVTDCTRGDDDAIML